LSDAIVAAVFTSNRLPSLIVQMKSPFEMLFHKLSAYDLFKCFGILCYPHLRPYNKHKMDFRSKRCIFIGYSASHKGYKCVDSAGKIFVVRHIVFDETCFPMKMVTISFNLTLNLSLSLLLLLLCRLYLLFIRLHHVVEPFKTLSLPPATDNSMQVIPSVAGTDEAPTTTINELSSTPFPESVNVSVSNQHSMVTRSKVGILKPKAYIAAAEPVSVIAAIQSPHWFGAMKA
jgi:histone deacetylase 1/2